jgi:hypothetical protein
MTQKAIIASLSHAGYLSNDFDFSLTGTWLNYYFFYSYVHTMLGSFLSAKLFWREATGFWFLRSYNE